jgi:lysozyme
VAVKHSIEAQLTLHEGHRRKLYRCSAGYLSGGVGRNFDANGLRDDEIALMLRNDIDEAGRQLDKLLPWWRGLDGVRQKVMVDMMFNLGPKSLAGFANTLRDVRFGRYAAAADRMLKSKWAAQVGPRAKRLARMMRTGEDYTT